MDQIKNIVHITEFKYIQKIEEMEEEEKYKDEEE